MLRLLIFGGCGYEKIRARSRKVSLSKTLFYVSFPCILQYVQNLCLLNFKKIKSLKKYTFFNIKKVKTKILCHLWFANDLDDILILTGN